LDIIQHVKKITALDIIMLKEGWTKDPSCYASVFKKRLVSEFFPSNMGITGIPEHTVVCNHME
jgi:hypothetical protein